MTPLRRLLGAFTPFTATLLIGILMLLTPAQAQEGTSATTPPSAALIEILKDDAARGALIADLERSLQASTAVAEEEPARPVSISRRLAEMTQGVAEQIASRAAALWAEIVSSRAVFSNLTGEEITVLIAAFWELALVIVLTVGIFLTLRLSAIPLYRRMGDRAVGAGMTRTGLLFLGGAVIDTLLVVTAWAAGYAVNLFVVGEVGQISLHQTLYLNAFLAVEIVKVAIRAILSPSSAGLRSLPMSDAAARALTRHANLLVGAIGYGQLLVVPIINQNAGYLAGRSVSVLLSVFVLVYLISLVLLRRRAVAEWLVGRLQKSLPELIDGADAQAELPGVDRGRSAPARKGVLVHLAQHWHWAALAYLTGMFLVVMTRSTAAAISALEASGKVLLAVIVASILSGMLTRAMARGITLSPEINAKLPLFEMRLNSFVPRVLFVLRLALLIVVGFFALGAVGLIQAGAWLESDLGIRITSTAVSLAAIFLVAGIIWLAMNAWIDYRLNPEYGSVPSARETTLLSLLRNGATIALLVFTAMFSLSEIGLDIGPLIASAGVLGLAIGFGSQKLVQDIITGIFIQFDNAMNVGDVVTVGGITGSVEKLTVRSASLRDVHGAYHIIPFSAVSAVSNFTRDFSYFVADMGVAYRENVDEVKEAMFDAFAILKEDPDQGRFIIGDLEWMGLNSFGNSAVVLRARIKTSPGKQWGMGRAYNAIIKRIFEERGIEIPFPHQTILFGGAKDSAVPALPTPAAPKE